MDDSFPKEILKISDGLNKRKFSSVEITKEYLGRIKAYDREINSFITICEETAIESALEADKRIAKGTAGTLAGIPYANKDLFCTKDIVFQRFVIYGDKLKEYQNRFLERVEQYYSIIKK